MVSSCQEEADARLFFRHPERSEGSRAPARL